MSQNKEPLGFQYSVRDLLLSLVAVGFAMAVLALAAHSDVKPGIRPGVLIIKMEWAPWSDSDIDLWVKEPDATSPVGWSRKSGKDCDLLRDDLGYAVDPFSDNTEYVVCRKAIAGQYIADAMAFNVYDHKFPIPVKMTVIELKGTRQTLIQRKILLYHDGQQATAFEFRLDSAGALVPGSVAHVQVQLFAQKKNEGVGTFP